MDGMIIGYILKGCLCLHVCIENDCGGDTMPPTPNSPRLSDMAPDLL